jgi:hypothetical protein
MGLNTRGVFVNLFLVRTIVVGKLHGFNELVIQRPEVFVLDAPLLKEPPR